MNNINEKITRDEIKAMLAMIGAVYSGIQPVTVLVDAWYLVLHQWNLETVQKAVVQYLATNAEFAPKPGQINVLCERLAFKYLNLKATDHGAENTPIGRHAMELAERRNAWNPKAQFESPEDLERALRINRATVMRDFKLIYEQKADAVLQQVRLGKSEKQATLEITDTQKQLADAKSLLKTLGLNNFV